jgi:hypothetical protein
MKPIIIATFTYLYTIGEKLSHATIENNTSGIVPFNRYDTPSRDSGRKQQNLGTNEIRGKVIKPHKSGGGGGLNVR